MVSRWEDNAVLNRLNDVMERIWIGRLFQSQGALDINAFLPDDVGVLK